MSDMVDRNVAERRAVVPQANGMAVPLPLPPGRCSAMIRRGAL